MVNSTSLHRKTTTIDGEKVSYHVQGTGSPVILIHGLSGSSKWWQRNIHALSSNHEVYVLDLPGYGATRRKGKSLSLADGVRWLELFISTLHLGKVSLLGHSMGGYMALTFTAAHPEKVDRLVLVAPIGFETKKMLVAYLFPLLKIALYTHPRFFPILLLDAVKAGPRTLLRAAREVAAQDMRIETDLVFVPSLLVWGKNDTLVPVRIGRLLQRAIPDSRLVVLERAGHVPMFDQPDAFNAAVIDFLDCKDQ
jgi:pimeloyl-ACP methyl ester carboxylesterase